MSDPTNRPDPTNPPEPDLDEALRSLCGDLFSDLDSAALAMREMYLSMRRAGFTLLEGLILTAQLATNSKEDEGGE